VAARQFVWLPPLKNPIGASVVVTCECQIQTCANPKCHNEDRHLDVAGNHGRVCHPGVKQQKATILEKSLERLFRVAGGAPARQPSTYSLLGGYFTKEDLSSLFCGNLTKAAADERKLLALEYLDIIFDFPNGSVRLAKLDLLRDKFPAPTVEGDEDNNGVIRFDLKFPTTAPVGCPIEIWFDHAIVHETSPTHAEETLRFLENDPSHDPVASPAFRKIEGAKSRKYAALVAVANCLLQKKKLDFQPTFLFPVISSLGFLNKDMVDLQKCIVKTFKDSLGGSPRDDGLSNKILAGRFKVQLKNSLCFGLLKGNSLAVYNQGVRAVSKPP
jgi:hypothetical protein